MVETSFDLIETPVDAVDASGLACDLHLQMPDLRHDMSHRGLKPEYARLEVRNVGLKFVEHLPHMAQMLEHDIVRPVSHIATLANPGLTRQSILFQKMDAEAELLAPRPVLRGAPWPSYRV